eukprot:CAMPEP_0202693042 /NCGR_PEP_ID=MMETSP1385-20130828/7264_1 /ASSEMBLY_ACC=CAM_ASM_000861 /TAXON_ID=933848 /ORGANISM="Elphidium margaritaceum" /LENGTH=440 /DNA_ID=CAMNT_0049348671 /DNA_START=269 /DNA_END=1588 /DNA_ORIENTATION=+
MSSVSASTTSPTDHSHSSAQTSSNTTHSNTTHAHSVRSNRNHNHNQMYHCAPPPPLLNHDNNDKHKHNYHAHTQHKPTHKHSSTTATTTTTTNKLVANLRKHGGVEIAPISHATRIPQTNYTFNELLRKHQFTPSGGASMSPIKPNFTTLHLEQTQQSHTAAAAAAAATQPHSHSHSHSHSQHSMRGMSESPHETTSYSHSHSHHTPRSSEALMEAPTTIIKSEAHHPLLHLHHHSYVSSSSRSLDAERAAFRRKAIIEEPKKNVTAYQLYSKWKRTQKSPTSKSYPAAKAISLAWTELSQSEKDEWSKKSEQAKVHYNHKMQQWLQYVEEAKRLGVPVPTKSVKPILQPIKIKNLLNLIPDIAKYDKDTQFMLSKATEMFIQYYASKAADIASKLCSASHSDDNEEFQAHNVAISAEHCHDALETDHRFNFLRAVTVKN